MSALVDIEKYRFGSSIPTHTITPSKKPKKHLDKFIAGPISFEWVSKACMLGGKSANIAFALCYMKGLQKSCTVKLTHKTFHEFNVSTKTAGHLLKRMEDVGLISVVQLPGRSPQITIII